MTTPYIPTVETQMLVRRPVQLVFQAFIDPTVTTHFWFTKSSGQLEIDKKVIWEWEMYNISTQVFVREIVEDKKIVIEWGDPLTTVEFLFEPQTNNTTYVVIKSYGFTQTGQELIEVIKDNTGGFTTVLDSLKAFLEHGLKLNLIADKFPQHHNSTEKNFGKWQKAKK
ncbi:SRPBCC family protein [Lewinella sp. LCG006]|uniref:SRPBCC family protein n=1 Tax=Lewinella sp. LCG006 TaxID=3231911 RepID=UPI00345FBBEF